MRAAAAVIVPSSAIATALIRQSEPLHEDLTTRRIQGVSWTIDSAIAYRDGHDQQALPLLLRDLEKRFSVAEPSPQKKSSQRVAERPEQQRLAFGKKNNTSS
jgi:predicted component of type VI protein secretion system